MRASSHAAQIVAGSGPVVLTCEHASLDLPDPWSWPPQDRWLVGTHWSYDPGAAELTLALAELSGWPAALARFSRLLIDPNRPLDAATLCRDRADDRAIRLNHALTSRDRARRVDGFYEPYHAAVSDLVAAHPGELVCGVHTFSPVYEGSPRAMQVGVLFDRDEPLARAVASALRDAGYDVRLNEPWSGRDGLIYAPEHHAEIYGRQAIEIELRHDLATDPDWRAPFARVLHRALARAVG